MSRVTSALIDSPVGRLLGLRSTRIVGAVDEPGPRQPYVQCLDVRGWALALDGSDLDIVVELAGQVVCASAPRADRPDVHALFQRVRGSQTCGFRVRLDAGALPDVPRAELVVRAVAAGRPEISQVIGICMVERHAHLVEGFGRSDYGPVWDRASQSMDQARVSVCGTADTGEWERSGDATAADVRALAGVTTADEVLEIGCGAGRVGRFLAPHCQHWAGGDVSANMLHFAEQSLAGVPNVTLHRLNGYDLTGITDRSFDVVYCTGVFMHLDEWERYRYVRDAYRVLRPAGRLYIDNFNLLTDEGWGVFTDLLETDPAKRPSHVSRHSTPQELEAYALRARFTDVKVRTGGLWVTVTGRKPAGA